MGGRDFLVVKMFFEVGSWSFFSFQGGRLAKTGCGGAFDFKELHYILTLPFP